MKLFLLRHAMTARAESDAARRITPEGTRALEEVLGRRRRELAEVRAIHSSPFERVRETARVAARIIGHAGGIVDNPGLVKLAKGADIAAALPAPAPGGGDLLLVSHESTLCNLLLWLAGEDILLANSSLAAIETEELALGRGALLWQESPKHRGIRRTTAFADQF